MFDLAIVIPAYKNTFLDKTLNSLAYQTDNRFNVYIGDDHSPFDLINIIDNYKNKLNIFYSRFPDNIGAKDLVLHWQRCIKLTRQEKWLCLFSDDDLMEKDCVKNFYQTINKNGNSFDIYRFNTITIDKEDQILSINPIGPDVESSAQMAYNLLKGLRGNSMPDHVFSRKIYEQNDGFVFTEYAQGADWATSILFSQNKGMCIIPNANVRWRYSGLNISSLASANKTQMIVGHLQFIRWTLNHFNYLNDDTSTITYQMMIDALRANLKSILLYHYHGFRLSNTISLFDIYSKDLKLSYYQTIKELYEIEHAFVPILYGINKLFYRSKNKMRRVFASLKNHKA